MRWGLRAEACVLAVLTRAALRVLPVPRVAWLLGSLPRTRRPRGSTDRVGACLDAAAFGADRAAHPTCLFRSLVAFALLTRRHHDVVFQIGASRADGFAAHAWVSIGQTVLDGPSSAEHTALWQYRAHAAARA